MSRCKSCRAEIIWTKDVNTGRNVPVDADPVPNGNILVDGYESYVIARSELDQHESEPRHLNHFATCPNADRWRNKGTRT